MSLDRARAAGAQRAFRLPTQAEAPRVRPAFAAPRQKLLLRLAVPVESSSFLSCNPSGGPSARPLGGARRSGPQRACRDVRRPLSRATESANEEKDHSFHTWGYYPAINCLLPSNFLRSTLFYGRADPKSIGPPMSCRRGERSPDAFGPGGAAGETERNRYTCAAHPRFNPA